MSYWDAGDYEYDVTMIDGRVVRVRADDEHQALRRAPDEHRVSAVWARRVAA